MLYGSDHPESRSAGYVFRYSTPAIDATGIMALADDHVQAAAFDYFRTKLDVRAAARQIGRNGDSTWLGGASDHIGFVGILPAIQEVELQTTLAKKVGKLLTVVDAARANEHGPTCRMHVVIPPLCVV